MTSTTRTTCTIDQLCLSPHNQRTHADAVSPEAIAIMERSLIGKGQLEPLLVHPMRGSKKYGTHAGGRRYRAFKNLIARGELPADHPIDVKVREGFSDADLIADSMVENIGRRDMEAYETFAGVRRMHVLGETVDRIATKLGQDRTAIERMLRLGNLAKPIFEALAAGRIKVDQARAFGATEDGAAQLAAWDKVSAGMADLRQMPVDRIHAALGIGNRELDRLLVFVTEDAYLATGGRLEPDLFGPGLTRIADPDKLRDLADRALDVLRADIRRRTGRPDLRFISQAPQDQLGTTDHQLRVSVPDKAAAEIKLPGTDIVVQLYVDHAGKADFDFWWASRSAKYANQRSSTAVAAAPPRTVDAAIAADALKPAAAIGPQYDGSRQTADAALREEEGLSADGVSIFRSLRRWILRGLLVDDAEAGGDGATDYLVWTQLRLAMDMDARPSLLGVAKGIGADADPEIAREHVQAMPAHARWREVMDELRRQSFVTSTNMREAFGDYCASSVRLKRLAAAAVAGWSLERSLAADGYVVPVHDALARRLGVHFYNHDEIVRALWEPTPQLLGRIPSRQALAIAEPFIAADAFTSWAKAKAADVARRLTRVVTGEPVHGLRPDRAAAAARWVHPLLRFTPPEDEGDDGDSGPANDVAVELSEAAE